MKSCKIKLNKKLFGRKKVFVYFAEKCTKMNNLRLRIAKKEAFSHLGNASRRFFAASAAISAGALRQADSQHDLRIRLLL